METTARERLSLCLTLTLIPKTGSFKDERGDTDVTKIEREREMSVVVGGGGAIQLENEHHHHHKAMAQ